MEAGTCKETVLDNRKFTPENPPVTINVSAPGKVILHGDHSVVYGRLAVAASLGLRTSLEIIETSATGPTLTLKCKDINLDVNYSIKEIIDGIYKRGLSQLPDTSGYCIEHPEWLDQQKLLQNINEFLLKKPPSDPIMKMSIITFLYLYTAVFLPSGIPVRSMEIRAHTELRVGAGMGSSASFAVVIVGGLLGYIKQKFKKEPKYKNSGFNILQLGDVTTFNDQEKQSISCWAYHAEKITHGNPSGVDNATCTFGSLVQFKRGVDPVPLKLNNKLKALLIDTKVPRNTKELVQRVGDLRKRHTVMIDHVLDAMDEVAKKAIECLKKLSTLVSVQREDEISAEYAVLQELTIMNQNMLRTLGVSHPAIDRICAILLEKGMKAKLTGAGGGGFVLAIIPPWITNDTLETITQALINENFGYHILELGGEGVRMH